MTFNQALVWIFCTPLGWFGMIILGTIVYTVLDKARNK